MWHRPEHDKLVEVRLDPNPQSSAIWLSGSSVMIMSSWARSVRGRIMHFENELTKSGLEGSPRAKAEPARAAANASATRIVTREKVSSAEITKEDKATEGHGVCFYKLHAMRSMY